MRGFILGIVVTLLVITFGIYIYFSKGYAPVGVAAQAMPFEKKLAKMALHARVEKEAPKTAPIEANEANYLAGAHEYVEHCAMCHGIPNQELGPIGAGEFPKPPHLFKGKGVTDDEPGETYWKIANGIRLTGMPSFKGHFSETQMWQIALLLRNADKLPASVTTALTQPEEGMQHAVTGHQPAQFK